MAIPVTAEEIRAKKECDRISSDVLDSFSQLATVPDPTELCARIEVLCVRHMLLYVISDNLTHVFRQNYAPALQSGRTAHECIST